MKLILVTMFLHYSKIIDAFTDNFERVLGEDPQYVYNKTIQSKSSTIRDDVTQIPLSNSHLYANTPKHSDLDTLYNVNDPSGSSLKNILYTPPVSKNIDSPFEDRLTLRGSNIGTNTANNRRLQLPPILPGRMDKDRIPIKGPDTFWNLLENGKKTINTSVQKLPTDFPNYHESNITRTSDNYPRDSNTLNVVVPAMNNNITVTNIIRMLDGNNNNENNFINGRYQQNNNNNNKQLTISTTSKPSSSSSINLRNFEQTSYQRPFNPIPKVYRDYQPIRDDESAGTNNSNSNVETNRISPQSSEKSVSNFDLNKMNNFPIGLRTREILGIGWNFHVYLIAILFSGISCLSIFALIRIKATNWLLRSWYFIAIHILLIGIGSARSCYLLYDAYNVENTFSSPINRLLLNIVHPFFISIFSIMLMFILKSVDVECGDEHYDRITNLLLPVLSAYSIISILLEFYVEIFPLSWASYYLSQYLFTTFCVIFGFIYIRFYNFANRISFRKQNSVYGTTFTDPLRPCVAHALRVMFAISLLCLLMAAVHVIEMLSKSDPINVGSPHPWIWWAFQLSVSVIEVSICYLIFWAAIQRLEPVADEKQPKSHSGFPLFPYDSTTRCGGDLDNVGSGGGGGNGLLYSSVCNSNLAVYNYAIAPNHLPTTTSKPIYEDISQYYDSSSNTQSASMVFPSTNNFLYRTNDRHVIVTTHKLDVPNHREQSFRKYGEPKNRMYHSMGLDYHNKDPPPLPLPNPSKIMLHNQSKLKCEPIISIENDVSSDEEFQVHSPEPFGHLIGNTIMEKDFLST